MSLDLLLVLRSQYNQRILIAWSVFLDMEQWISFRFKTIKCRRLLLYPCWTDLKVSDVSRQRSGFEKDKEEERILEICHNPHKRWMRENLRIQSTLIWLGGVMYTLHRIVKEHLSRNKFSIKTVIFKVYLKKIISEGLTTSCWLGNGSTRGAKLASNCFIGALADAREHRDRTSHNSIRPAPCNRHLGSKFGLQEGFIALWGRSWFQLSLSLSL